MKRLRDAKRMLETLRHLRARQLASLVRRRLSTPRVRRTPPPRWRPVGHWCRPVAGPRNLMGPCRLRIHGVEREIASAADWSRSDWEPLWLYHAHYFDDLAAEDAAARQALHRNLMQRWIRENPPPRAPAWDPYPTSRRIVNWLKWRLAGNELDAEMTASLAVQVRVLTESLEHHLSGNHLLANAKALIMAGCAFGEHEGDAWLQAGLALMTTELRDQILADGGHVERSPMYHAIVLEDLLDVINVLQTCSVASVEPFRQPVVPMLAWLSSMTHPDGEVAFFNDATGGQARTYSELRCYASRLGIEVSRVGSPGSACLAASGYVRFQDSRCCGILDIAPLGPDHQPGHAHADTLAWELSLDGQRVVVNCGVSTYDAGPVREHERATRAHSTVEVDGRSSSDVWGAFRVGRRARPGGIAVDLDRGEIAAHHDGFGRRWTPTRHRRHWRFFPDGVRVTDLVTADHCTAISRIHLHPAIRVTAESDGCSGELILASGATVRWSVRGGVAEIVPSHYAPAFGVRESTRCLAIRFHEPEVETELRW